MKAPPKRKGKSVGQSATQAAGSLKESPSKKEREM